MLEHTDILLSRLDGVQKTSNGWEAFCPCRNDDENQSLAIHERDDGTILLYCHRGGGCNAPEIVKTVGLEMRDLIPKDQRAKKMNDDRPSYEYNKKTTTSQFTKKKKDPLKLVKAYDYYTADGELLFQKLRYIDEHGNKTFRQRKPDGNGGWVYKLDDTPKVLYNLPAVANAVKHGQKIIVVEGEKDADTLIALGRVATTMPGGAGKWLDIHTKAIAGADVVVIADNDEPGRKHAVQVGEALTTAGCTVKLMCTPEKKDITEFLESGGTIASLVEFEPSESDSVPLTDGEIKVNDEELDNEPVVEEAHEQTRVEMAIDKLANLFDKNLSPAQFINRASLIISAGLSDSITADTGRLIKWDEFLKESTGDAYDWIIEDLLERRERVIVVAAEGVGKRATIDSMIPTPSGWVRLGQIKVGDQVFDRFGSPVNVTYVSPVEENPDACRVTFSDGNYIDADAEHQWYTENIIERENRRIGSVRTTQEIKETLLSGRKSGALNHAIPVTKPLVLPEAELPIPPYTLGVWLGDGTSLDGSICTEDDEILVGVSGDGYEHRFRPSTKNIYGIIGLKGQLRSNNLLGNKHIPEIYSRASYEQRLALIQGLMDTDGTIDKRGSCEFSVTNKVLARSFLDLLLTLGVKATMREADAKLYGRVTGTRYRVSFKTDLPVFRLSRKRDRLPKSLPTPRSLYRYITSVEKIDPTPMLCISVDGPDNTYLIGEAYIPTHNTMLARQVAILSANGIHPFTWQRIKPIKTLTVDLENPERIIRRTSGNIMAEARSMNYSIDSHAYLVTKPDGLNLLSANDRLILETYLDDVKPDLLVMGPLYKAFLDPGTKTSEAVAIEVVKYLDTIRTVYGCALWLEHHAPLGSSMSTRDLRPFGSAVWSRWPEFGLSLVPDPMAVGEYVYDVKHFRGERDVRDWPTKMRRGKKFPFEAIEFKDPRR